MHQNQLGVHLCQRSRHINIIRCATRCIPAQRPSLQIQHRARNSRRMRELKATLAAIDAFTIAGAAKTDRLVTIRKTRDEPPTRGFSVQVRKPAKLLSMNRFSKQFLSNISEQDIAAHGDDATALICPHRSTNRGTIAYVTSDPSIAARPSDSARSKEKPRRIRFSGNTASSRT